MRRFDDELDVFVRVRRTVQTSRFGASNVAIDGYGDIELGRSGEQLHDRLANLAGADQRQLRGRRGIHAATVHPENSQAGPTWHGRLATNET